MREIQTEIKMVIMREINLGSEKQTEIEMGIMREINSGLQKEKVMDLEKVTG